MDAVSPANDKRSATYRIVFGWRIFSAGFCVAVIGAALAGIYLALTGTMPIWGAVVVGMLMIVLASAATWGLVEMLTWRAIFSTDAVEASSYWRTRQLKRSEIKGCRGFAGSGRAGPVIVLVPVASDRKTISLSLRYMQKDAAFSGGSRVCATSTPKTCRIRLTKLPPIPRSERRRSSACDV